MSQSTTRVRVAPSGQAIAFECFGPDGVTPANITSFAGLAEAQTLTTGAGTPASRAVTLTYGGATTAPIPWRRVPPSTAYLFVATLPAAGTYDVQVCTPIISNTSNTYQAYDGALPAGAAVAVDLGSTANAAYTDAASGAKFRSIGPRSFSTTSATIEVTAVPGVYISVSAVRLQPQGGGQAIIVACNATSNGVFSADRGPYPMSTQRIANDVYGGWYPPGYINQQSITDLPSFQPSSYYLDPGDVQAAIVGLAGYGAGSCAATTTFNVGRIDGTGVSTPPTPRSIALAFGGPKASVGVGAPTTSDPLASAAVTHPGGQPLRFRINGGAATPVVPDAIVAGTGQSWFLHILPQSDVYPDAVGSGIATIDANGYGFRLAGVVATGVGRGNYSYAGNVASLPAYPVGVGNAAVFPFEGLPPGNYRLDATWPVLPIATAQARFSIAATGSSSPTVVAVDQTKAPQGNALPAGAGFGWQSLGTFNLTAPINDLTTSLTSADGAFAIGDAVRLVRTSPDLSIRISPADVVTIDAPAGAIATDAGPSAALVGVVAPHASGSLLPDPSTVVPTMTAGWNACQEYQDAGNVWHLNLAKRAASPFSGVVNGDADGNPTALAEGTARSYCICIERTSDGEVAGLGVPVVPNLPQGVWTLEWDDASGGQSPGPDLCDEFQNAYPEVILLTTVTGRATGNRRHFHCYDPQATHPIVGYRFYPFGPAFADGTQPVTIRNLGLYPPRPDGSAWLAPRPVWHPAVTARLAGCPIRTLDLTNAAASNNVTAADVARSTYRSLSGSNRPPVAIAKIEQDTNPDGFYNQSIGPVIRVTTATDHPFQDTNAVVLSGVPPISVRMNGQAFGPADLNNYYHFIHKTGPNRFEFVIELNRQLDPSLNNWVATNLPMTPAGATAAIDQNRATPYEDIAALGIEANAPSLHVPIPLGAGLGVLAPSHPVLAPVDTSLIDHILDCLLLTPRGMKILLEVSNETWNTGNVEWGKCCYLSHALGVSPGGYDYANGYVAITAAVHAYAHARFASVGRGDDLIRAYATQQGNSFTTTAVASACKGNGYPMDLLLIAPYLEGAPDVAFGADQHSRFHLYSPGQSLDLLELVTEYGPMRSTFQQHAAALASVGITRPDGSKVPVGAYEGGIEQPIAIDPSGYEPRIVLRQTCAMNDPRMFRLSRRILELAQLGGCSTWQEYREGLKFLGSVTWDKHVGTYRPYGTGDPAKDVANVYPYRNKALVASQVGGAYRAWADAISARKQPTRPIPYPFFFPTAWGI